MLDIRELMNLKEAYNAVYAPQELTEDQVWEGVEEWVNALIEEGYDLSDYTWKEMYGAYIEEASDLDMGLGRKVLRNRAKQTRPAPTRSSGSEANPPSAAQARRDEADPRRNPTPAAGAPPKEDAAKPTSPAAGAPPKEDAAKPTSPAAGQVLSKLDGVEGTGVGKDFKARSWTDAEKSRYNEKRGADQLAKDAAQVATNKAKQTPTEAPAGNTLSQTVDAASKPAAFIPTSTETPATKPALKKPSPIVSGFDYFDAVKGYLIGEGYADTEEAALAIMANMSEEWKQSILSEDPVQDYRDMKRANQNAAGMRGPELSHSSKGPMSPGSATQKPQPRSREFSHGNQDGKPGPMKNPGPNFGRG